MEEKLVKETYSVKEVAIIYGVSESKASNMIRDLNKILKEQGAPISAGMISKKFFREMLKL